MIDALTVYRNEDHNTHRNVHRRSNTNSKRWQRGLRRY
ncbi:MAG: hypothetical protein ACI9OU_001083 [Candidatus Promineifilaceae bacterium]|jgi:hypothetical protein